MLLLTDATTREGTLLHARMDVILSAEAGKMDFSVLPDSPKPIWLRCIVRSTC
jgi:hypothetical protein